MAETWLLPHLSAVHQPEPKVLLLLWLELGLFRKQQSTELQEHCIYQRYAGGAQGCHDMASSTSFFLALA